MFDWVSREDWTCFILAMLGLVIVGVAHRKYGIVFVPFLLQGLMPVVFHPDERYRYACMPALFVLAALTLVTIVSIGVRVCSFWSKRNSEGASAPPNPSPAALTTRAA